MARLGVQFLAVGDDFRFGASRAGDFLLLQTAGAEYGFAVSSTQTFCEGGMRISSTAVRQALAEDNLALAESLLGHPFTISGRVVHGDELGRTIGFPDGKFTAAPSGLPGERGLCGGSHRAWR
ncbi:riboflavin biosynthesis protein RibF [Salmonella enterica subsp. arizonae]|uniref:Riboflavin biosynthesis protein RibF n=1 Tax=Salmonella enterica subsp. arizonae TaxID=59203 RepID=A0A2X4WTQ6_SALER|nr:riboflavin biosynthesis protein RibF [Salmonella enterica subsp. arizonae]